ncbi:hypothetical protein LCGC14_0343450 [marine sediment metagenome]|uniref:Uncharacterized protein n=1 Tax=marine sediment metagenome TaxID=412755 RepID=A0A0F9TW23_9ZZZZ
MALVLEDETLDGSLVLPQRYTKSNDAMRVLLVGPAVKDLVIGDIVQKPAMIKAAEKRNVLEDLTVEISGVKCVIVEDEDVHFVLRDCLDDYVEEAGDISKCFGGGD